MLDLLDITEEEARGLAELAQHDLAMARDFARRAQAAEESSEANELARSYQRAARSYRQTLALKARLKRDLAAALHVQADTPPPRPGGAAVARRIGELRTAFDRLAWNEAERCEAEADESEGLDAAFGVFDLLRDKAEDSLTQDRRTHSFGEETLDDHVARLALDARFRPEAIVRWRDLPDPPPQALDPDAADDPPEDHARRSSA